MEAGAARRRTATHWLATLEAAGVPVRADQQRGGGGRVAADGRRAAWWCRPAACPCPATRSRAPAGPTRCSGPPAPRSTSTATPAARGAGAPVSLTLLAGPRPARGLRVRAVRRHARGRQAAGRLRRARARRRRGARRGPAARRPARRAPAGGAAGPGLPADDARGGPAGVLLQPAGRPPAPARCGCCDAAGLGLFVAAGTTRRRSTPASGRPGDHPRRASPASAAALPATCWSARCRSCCGARSTRVPALLGAAVVVLADALERRTRTAAACRRRRWCSACACSGSGATGTRPVAPRRRRDLDRGLATAGRAAVGAALAGCRR